MKTKEEKKQKTLLREKQDSVMCMTNPKKNLAEREREREEERRDKNK